MLKDIIRTYPDFPKKGINFVDIMPIFNNPQAVQEMCDELSNRFSSFDYIAGIESRGFLVGMALATRVGKGFVPIRKAGKLPGEVFSAKYSTEYSSDCLEIQKSSFEKGSRVLIVDDLLATGGTAYTSAELVKLAGGEVVGFGFIAELSYISGRDMLEKVAPVYSIFKVND